MHTSDRRKRPCRPARLIHTVVFGPEGTTVASGGADGAIDLWVFVLGKDNSRGPGSGARSFRWRSTPTGRRWRPGVSDGSLRLWDPVGGHERLRLPGHPEKVNAVTFAASRTVL